MNQVTETFYASYEVKKSTFTSYILPYEDFTNTLENIQSNHPKASHVVWAYRYLNAYEQIVENSTDNGEPKGCAGLPTLSHLRGSSLINTAMITIRYFGGIKLGTGGMVRAYGSAAQKVIQSTTISPYIKKSAFTLKTPYKLLRHYEYFCTQEKIDFSHREYLEHEVIWHLYISRSQEEALNHFSKSHSSHSSGNIL